MVKNIVEKTIKALELRIMEELGNYLSAKTLELSEAKKRTHQIHC